MKTNQLIAYLMIAGVMITGAAILPFSMGSARGDILIRADQTPVSGKVISQDDNQVIFQPDGADAPQHIPRSQVMQVIITDAQGHILPNPPTAASAAPATSEVPVASPRPMGARVLLIEPLTPPQSPYVTDTEIGQAISKGAKYLADQFTDSALVESGVSGEMRERRLAGADALAVYALLECGTAIEEPRYGKDNQFMKGLIDKMKTQTSKQYDTYSRGIRAACLALLDRPEDGPVLNADIKGLLASCSNGGYTYTSPITETQTGSGIPVRTPQGIVIDRSRTTVRVMNTNYDNSNSQYGLLGVWSAAEIGAEVPNDYWQAVEGHWTQCQLPDGEWPYQPMQGAKYSMTMAGLASMFVCHDYIDLAKFGAQVGREPFSPPLAKGLAWMETGDNSVPPAEDGYSVYGLERVGLACGFKYFAAHDWYREVATQLVHSQQADGSWHNNFLLGTDVDTSYMLLFLARGRHPILMNKLRFEHYWDNRPRDVANLAAFASKELEFALNWQVVDLRHDWHDWSDSPILFVASHVPPKLTDDDYARIRAFVNSGGMLFTQADGGSAEFNDYVKNVLLRKVFPDFEMKTIPGDSPVYSVYEPMKTKFPLEGVSNGARLLWVHSPADISQWWQQRAIKTHKDAFELGMNLFVYAAGKRDFQNRIATSYIPEPPSSTGGDAAKVMNAVKVARIKYPLATWDPEPYAWTRFANYLQWQTSVKLNTEPVDMENLGGLSPADVPLAALTGTMPYTPTDAQIQSLKKYVDEGGVLFIDACGGGGFNESIQAILGKAFPGIPAQLLTATSPLMSQTLNGMSALSTLPVRQYVVSLEEKTPGFSTYASGKGLVIYSPRDVTNGLLGSQTWGIAGYTGPFCLDFMKNLVLWSAQGMPTTPHLTPQPVPSHDVVSKDNSPIHRPPGFPNRGRMPPVGAMPAAVHLDHLPPSAVATDQLGGHGGSPFTHVSAAAQAIVGFAYKLGHWDKPVIADLRPIYDVAAPRDAGMLAVTARDGYAVAGVLDDTDNVNTVAIKVIFARLKNGQVDLTDSYQSDWIGTPDANNPVQLAGHGETVIGDFGRKGMNLDAMGLIVIPNAAANAINAAPAAVPAATAGPTPTSQIRPGDGAAAPPADAPPSMPPTAAPASAAVSPSAAPAPSTAAPAPMSGYTSADFLHLPGLPKGALTTLQIGGLAPSTRDYNRIGSDGAPVIAFRYELRSADGKTAIHRFEPVFSAVPANPADAHWEILKSRDGYVVTGLLINTDRKTILGLKVLFARYKDERVDATDTYQSDWIGSSDEAPRQLAGNGEKVIGLFSRYKDGQLLSIGLIVLPTEKANRE